jgi:uncharacterized protein (DUF1778 family)
MNSTRSQTAHERTEQFGAPITRSQKALFLQAAALQGRTLSDFVIQAASEAATRVIQDQQFMAPTNSGTEGVCGSFNQSPGAAIPILSPRRLIGRRALT